MQTVSQPAIDQLQPFSDRAWSFLKRELAPTPDRLASSVRVAVAAAIITLIGETARSEQLFLALFVILLIPKNDPKMTWRAAWNVVSISWASAAVAFGIDILVADFPWLRVPVIGFSIFFCMLLSRALHQPLIGLLGSVVICQTLIQLDGSNNGEASIESTLWLALMLSMGVIVAAVVESGFPRPGPLERVAGGLTERLESVRAVLRGSAGAQLSGAEEDAAKQLRSFVSTGSGSLQALLPTIVKGHLLDSDTVLRLSYIVSRIDPLTDLVMQLDSQTPYLWTPLERERLLSLSQVTSNLTEWCSRLSGASAKEGPQIRLVGKDRISAPFLNEVAAILDELSNVLTVMPAPDDEVSLRDLQPEAISPAPMQPLFLAENVHFAFKVALASMVCYVIYNGVAWQGISSALVTCFIVATDTVGATFRKLALRLIGVVIGGVVFGIAGIAFFLCHMDNVVELLLYVMPVFFVAGWVVKGSQRISHAGVQIGLSFALVAMMHPTIPDQIVEARDRVVGVALGAVVMWFIFGRLWPANALADQKQKIAALLGMIANLVSLRQEAPTRSGLLRIRKIRADAGQVIIGVNDQADSAGYDSHYDERVETLLRQSLRETQDLLAIELAELGASRVRLAGSEELISAPELKQDEEYKDFLQGLAKQVTIRDQDSFDRLKNTLTSSLGSSGSNVVAANGLDEPYQLSDISEGFDTHSAISQRRARICDQLLEDVHSLVATSREAMANLP